MIVMIVTCIVHISLTCLKMFFFVIRFGAYDIKVIVATNKIAVFKYVLRTLLEL